MRAEVIAIGTELLLGFTPNSDATFIGRLLSSLGIDCYHHVTVGDNRERLTQAIRTAFDRADLVITCGGLGPTVDDITLETVASVTRRPLLLNSHLLKAIRSRFSRLKIRMPRTNIRQAMIPQGAVVFPNSVGTAPGFLLKFNPSSSPSMSSPTRSGISLEGRLQRGSIPAFAGMTHEGKKILVALPGPPAELIPMARKYLVPRLRRYTGKTVIHSKTLKVTGLTESEVDAKITDILKLKGAVTVGIYAHPGQVDLRITTKAPHEKSARRLIAGVESKIRRRLKGLIFGADEETLEGVVGKLLKQRKLTLGVAESCTGGLIQHRITEVPGSSDYFRGGVVVYSNALKESFLGVSGTLLKRYGAVSSQVAAAMARGIRKKSNADIGLSVTGIAGPTVAAAKGSRTTALRPGGTKKKPVGLVYIGFSTPKGTRAFRHQFSGDRSTVKLKASQAALDLIRRYVIASGRGALSARKRSNPVLKSRLPRPPSAASQ